MPVPMMLAITMEHAVTKPIVRLGPGAFTERGSAIVVMVGPTRNNRDSRIFLELHSSAFLANRLAASRFERGNWFLF
jgi:hypothetical protein